MTIDARISRLCRTTFFAGLAFSLMACSPREEPGSNGAMAGMMEDGMPMMRDMPEGMMSGEGMMGPGMMQDMRPIHGLLTNHERIERRVEDIPGGVRTVTTSSDPKIAQLIRAHVRQMKERYARGQPIRSMDPVFRELFRNRHRASLEYEDIPGGIRVTHTSNDPNVVLLIRQHARRFVSEAAAEGMRRAMRPTPLPEGYRPPTD
jgi:hypothetical protein